MTEPTPKSFEIYQRMRRFKQDCKSQGFSDIEFMSCLSTFLAVMIAEGSTAEQAKDFCSLFFKNVLDLQKELKEYD